MTDFDGRPGRPQPAPIAILGMGCRFPGGVTNAATLWRLLHEGVHASAELSARRARLQGLGGGGGGRRGPFLEDVDLFDAGFFGISESEARSMDPQQRLVLEVAWEAFEAAGRPAGRLAGSSTGVFLGIYGSDYAWLQSELEGEGSLYTGLGAGQSIAANRLSYLLDLRGPSVAVDTTCSSSLVAVHLACRSLQARECDLAIAGGVNLILSEEVDRTVSRLVPVAADGRCKAFDAAADGIVRGEGCGLVVLARQEDALLSGDEIVAVIAGSAVNQDGRSNGFTAPNPESQLALYRRTLAEAGVAAAEIGMIEAHGTGTPLGDPIELEAIAEALAASPREAPCLVTSIKTNLGHTEAAAGVAGLMKAALCVQNGVVAPNLHFQELNPEISLPSGIVEIPEGPRSWPSAGPRYAAASSFSIGGTNCQVVVGEAPAAEAAPNEPEENGRERTLLASAGSPKALRRRAESLLELVSSPEPALRDLCHTAAVRQTHHGERLAVVGEDRRAIADGLRSFLAGDRAPSVVAGAAAETPPELVFVFSGQGLEWPAMGAALLAEEPVFARALEPFARFADEVGVTLEELLSDAGNARLAEPLHALAATFAMQTGLVALLADWGIRPAAVVGHSGGEVAAALAAGALAPGDALRVLVERGRVLQKLHGRGAMAAVELTAEAAREALATHGAGVDLAAVNSSRSCVVSGDPTSLRELLDALEDRGVRYRELASRSAFHGRQLDGLDAELTRALSGLSPRAASIPIVSTVTGETSSRGDQIAAYWGRGVRATVQFERAIQRLVDDGYRHFVEISPHPALARHVATIEAPEELTVRTTLRRQAPWRRSLLRTVAALHCDGATVDWSAIGDGGRHVALPSYPWERSSYWFGEPSASGDPGSGATPETGAYTVEWRPAAAASFDRSIAPFSATPEEVGAELRERLPVLAAEAGLDRYREMEPAVDALCGAYSHRCLTDLGALDVETGLEVDEWARRLGVKARHVQLFSRVLALLEEDGVLDRSEHGLELAARDPIEVAAAEAELARLKALYPRSAAELDLLGRCGPRLAAVLRGEDDPLELLFPGGSMTEAEALYSDTPFARTFNRLLAEALAASLDDLDEGRPLRLLEIGAGTGGTTRFVLDALRGREIEYWFTDVSAAFLPRARATYGTADGLEYRRLDIESDPEPQGIDLAGFDIVIAANVLHATNRLRASLGNARRLLKPGGLLYLLEVTAPQRLVDLTFGMTSDWWTVGDDSVRDEHPLLDVPAWSSLLTEAGFDEVAAVPSAEESRESWGAAVLVSRNPAERGEPAVDGSAGRWLLLADAGQTANAVERELVARGGEVSVLTGLALEDEAGAVAAIARALGGGRAGWRGVLDLRPLDSTGVGRADAGQVQSSAELSCTGSLAVLRALTDEIAGEAPRLWIATRGAQPASPGRPVPAAAQSTLWGLAAVLEAEHPELFGGVVDLDPADRSSDGSRLAGELLARELPVTVAYRSGRRHEPRLAPVEVLENDSDGRLPVRDDGAYLVTGGLGGMGLHVAEWLAERGAGSIVLVGRKGGEGAEQRVVARVDGLRERGVEVEVRAVDVTDDAAVAALIGELASRPRPLRGVVHAAGVFEDRVLRRQDRELLARVLAPKVRGAWNLHAATRKLPIDFFVMFSSAAGLLGMAGLGNYAAANAFLDALAHHRRALGLPATSIDWAGWTGVGMAAQLGERRESQWASIGLDSVTPEEGLRWMETLATSEHPQAAVVTISWSRFFAGFADGKGPRRLGELRDRAASPARDRSGELEDRLAQVDESMRGELLFEHVRDLAASLLELPPGETIERSRPLAELGLDSLLALELRNTLAVTTGLPLGVTLLFDHPSLDALTGHLAEQLGVVWGAPAAAPEGADLDALLGGLEEMDEESVEGVLSDMASELFSAVEPAAGEEPDG